MAIKAVIRLCSGAGIYTDWHGTILSSVSDGWGEFYINSSCKPWSLGIDSFQIEAYVWSLCSWRMYDTKWFYVVNCNFEWIFCHCAVNVIPNQYDFLLRYTHTHTQVIFWKCFLYIIWKLLGSRTEFWLQNVVFLCHFKKKLKHLWY